MDEVFIDATAYLNTYKTTAHDFARMLIKDVLETTGITATAGIGTNLYLCKIAMDIVAKHISADEDGVRIAELNEEKYKETLWGHKPITDFWRVGPGIAKRLERIGIYTMGDIARYSLNRNTIGILYRELGKNAELLIDHAWGIEPTTIKDVKAYKPQNSSISSGQVLQEPCDSNRTRLIVWEMADMLSLDLVEKGLVTDKIVLTVGYDVESLKNTDYKGEVTIDRYGRKVPKHAHGTIGLDKHTSSTKKIIDATMTLYDRIINEDLLSRRITIVADNVIKEEDKPEREQLSLFDMIDGKAEDEQKKKERSIQEAMLKTKHKYGKNAILKGKNYIEGATAKERNKQIGGHKA